MTRDKAAGATNHHPSLESALLAIMQSVDSDATEVRGLSRMSGGASQEIWAFTLARAGRPHLELILRRAPDAKRPGNAAPGPEIEARIVRLVEAAGVPVPGIRATLMPSDGVGRGFIMDRVEGETLARRIIRDAKYVLARKKFADQCAGILARIHNVDASNAGLRLSSVAGEVDDLWRQYQRSGALRPVFECAFLWLRNNLPPQGPPRLVHGDFRNGNLIFGPEGVRAVLDWELAHLGDPLEDLGWLFVNSWRFGEIDREAGGIATRKQLLDAYRQATGRDIDEAAVRFWEMLGTLRWGIMCAGMVQWISEGIDTSVERCMIARRASECEIDLMRLLPPKEVVHAG